MADDKNTNPYCNGDWVMLSPFGNAEQRRSMIRRSSISIVVRLQPTVLTPPGSRDPDGLHGVAIRADGAEQIVRFGGDDGAAQADLLVQACLGHPKGMVQVFDEDGRVAAQRWFTTPDERYAFVDKMLRR